MKIGAQKVIDEFLFFLVIGAAGLVLEHDIVVPSPFDVEVARVQERVSPRYIELSLLLLLDGLFSLLN